MGFWRGIGEYLGLVESEQRWGTTPPIPTNGSLAWTSYTDLAAGLGTAESSLQQVAVWAAVNLLATQAATLPVDVLTGDGAATRPVPTPPWLADLGGDGYGLHDWVYQYMTSALLRGNVYGQVTDRDPRTGQPRQVVLQHPDNVLGWRDPQSGLPKWRVGGVEVERTDVWHQRAYVLPGRLLGLSPIAHHATTVGLGMTARRFGLQWFTDGAHPSGILINEEAEMDKATTDITKQRFVAAVRGNREPLVLGRGWKFQPVQVGAAESQFLETQRYTAAECARIYGPALPEILGYETGGSMTYANVEQRNLDLLTYSVDPWLTRIERAFTALLAPGQYAKFNRAALLRTATLDRYKAHRLALAYGWKTINEVRENEDMGPVAWGAEPWVGVGVSENEVGGGG